MTSILMYHIRTLQAFWVNTPDLADAISREEPLFAVVEVGDPHYGTIAALAGASDLLA
jgi:hypothetical protein